MYGGYLLYYVGIGLVTASWLYLAVLFVYEIALYWLIRGEERWCLATYGEPYRRYMQQVRRYVGRRSRGLLGPSTPTHYSPLPDHLPFPYAELSYNKARSKNTRGAPSNRLRMSRFSGNRLLLWECVMEHRTVKQEEDIAPEQAEPPGSGLPSFHYLPPSLERSQPSDQPTLRTPRPALWADVPDEQWDDWRWQLAHRLNSVDELAQIIHLTPEEIEGLTADDKFRVDITPYFASLIDPDDPNCPIRRQVVPLGRELQAFEGMMEDSLAEDKHSPVPGLVHRYPDRVLMLVTTQCASYCRYCTRSRIVGNPARTSAARNSNFSLTTAAHLQVRDVLLSGGDPLTLAPKTLEHILSSLRAIPHIEIIRIGSRVPVFLPQRITDEFVDMLKRYHPLWMNIHVNHPKEITPELSRALDRLAYAGVPLGNQSVLLAGSTTASTSSASWCTTGPQRVRPTTSTSAIWSRARGISARRSPGHRDHRGLRGHTSGYAIDLRCDAPGGGGKSRSCRNT